MASATPLMTVLAKAWAFGRWLLASLKSQWLATVLIIPLGLFALQTQTARQDAREARAKAVAVDRLGKVQSSGKALDAALANYFQAIGELALAERKIEVPGSYAVASVDKAQSAVIGSRKEAEKALADHAGDIQSLHGSLDTVSEQRYMTSLASVSAVIESDADINQTGRNIKTLGQLVVARDALVDRAMGKAI